MLRQTIIFSFFVLTLIISLTSYAGGESTYKSICIACHASGLNGAPNKYKDPKLISFALKKQFYV